MREHAADPQIRDYEMMVVVTPTVTEDGLATVVERVSGYITEQSGTVDSASTQSPWGRRRLAYPIQDHHDAFYVLYRFHAQPDSIIEIEREIKLDEQVIRYLVVRYDEMTEHEERPQGGRRGDSASPARQAPAAPAPSAPADVVTEETVAPAVAEDAPSGSEE